MTASIQNEKKQQAAVRAAAAVFADQGYHGSSTRDIAERMGIQQGSLYYYFKSKEDALSAVCLYGMQDYAERMDAIAANNEPFVSKLRATVTSHLARYREKNEAMRVYNAERLYLPAEKRTRLHELGSGYRQKLQAIFEQATAAGEIRPEIDCHFAAQAVIGLCNAWGELIVRDPDLDLYDIIEKCVGLLLNGFTNTITKE